MTPRHHLRALPRATGTAAGRPRQRVCQAALGLVLPDEARQTVPPSLIGRAWLAALGLFFPKVRHD